MLVNGKKYESIWLDDNAGDIVWVIDQQKLPFFFETKALRSVDDIYNAISDMTVRGAPLIGAAGAFGIYLATLELTIHSNINNHLGNAAEYLKSCRPTAVNLSWAVDYMIKETAGITDPQLLSDTARQAALGICRDEKDNCHKIGVNGLQIIQDISRKKGGKPVNILTHCNAGWLACIDYGTATAPIYLAHEKGIPVHVWVDETRPKNQGARLTAWELGNQGIHYTLIPDNTGGYLMQKGMVDTVFVGCDRATRKGDIANKIGTYLKALAAYENGIPFYALMPSSSIDLSLYDGLSEIVIEERDQDEVITVSGYADGSIKAVRICPDDAKAFNPAFDVTPSRFVTGFITEKGVCKADEENIMNLF